MTHTKRPDKPIAPKRPAGCRHRIYTFLSIERPLLIPFPLQLKFTIQNRPSTKNTKSDATNNHKNSVNDLHDCNRRPFATPFTANSTRIYGFKECKTWPFSQLFLFERQAMNTYHTGIQTFRSSLNNRLFSSIRQPHQTKRLIDTPTAHVSRCRINVV